MRVRLALLAAVALLAASASTALAANPPTPAFGGPLDGSQEVPAVAGSATGQATVVISGDGSTIWYVVEYSGLSGPLSAAHIHVGAAGVSGGVILPLAASASPMVGLLTASNFTPSGAITTFAEAVAAIKVGGTYVNLHTAANPSGEIRGQVVAKGSAYFGALSGSQEVPAVTTAGTGTGWVVISTDGSTITYYLAYSGLSGAATAAHIHLGNVGTSGGVMLPLVVGASPMTGTLTSADLKPTGSVTDLAGAVTAIAAGGTYFNIHTAANPGGEIRGQIAVTVAPAATTSPSIPPTATVELPSANSNWLPIMVMIVAIATVAAAVMPRRRRPIKAPTRSAADRR